jgi:hypothetical protein
MAASNICERASELFADERNSLLRGLLLPEEPTGRATPDAGRVTTSLIFHPSDQLTISQPQVDIDRKRKFKI